MWSYYGSKANIVHLYPPPKYGKIIEPFAGSARYSLRYWDREILLIDKYDVIVRIWKWLQQCSPGDIIGLPKLKTGLDLRTLNISEDERLFLGMLAATSSTCPRWKVSMFSGEQNGRKNRNKIIADQLHKIKHWTILQGDYYDFQDREDQVVFIDPPYQHGGNAYKHSNKKIDFKELAQWTMERPGQVIVCENTKADWLPFLPMVRSRGSNQLFTTEAIWSNRPTAFDNEQLILF